jgi:transcriptional regulator with XRE-family HTH domain
MQRTKKTLTLGEKLKKARQYSGLSQKQLGEILQLSDKTVSAYEVNRAEPSLDILQQIAQATKTPIHYFFTQSDSNIETDLKIMFERIERELLDVKELLNKQEML